tara:strand:+ start:95 stop:733 length:639 start_codon:yes stop_codon:yes gene_type:complete
MNIAVVYVYPDLNARLYKPLAKRFVSSYMEHPPGESDHQLHVAVNFGRPGNTEYDRLFSPLMPRFLMHDNSGKDIGAFQFASQTIPCDLMVFLGAPVHFRQGGWLDRIVRVYEQYGPAFYGCWGFHQPAMHIRTTAFWCAPEILNSYPYNVNDSSRYEFEHGQRSIANHVVKLGLPVFMVTWNGCYPVESWHHVENKDCLMLDQHTDGLSYQ